MENYLLEGVLAYQAKVSRRVTPLNTLCNPLNVFYRYIRLIVSEPYDRSKCLFPRLSPGIDLFKVFGSSIFRPFFSQDAFPEH